MPHDHHHHDHAHDHGPHGHDRAFAIGTALNLGFVAAELVFGIAANSMALLADAAHNLGDVLGLLLGWGPPGSPACRPRAAAPMAGAAAPSWRRC